MQELKQIWQNFVDMNVNFHQLEYCIRILIAAFCGAVIGLERKKRFKDAGIRTHLILSIGCAVIMIISKYAFIDSKLLGLNVDAARVASNIITGVGFLGAGVIFIKSGSVRGLTTAAGIWTTAAIGMALGAGFYFIGIFTTVLLLILQIILHRWVPGFEAIDVAELLFKVKKTPTILQDVKAELENHGIHITTMKVKKNDLDFELRFSVKLHKDQSLQALLELLSSNDDIIEISTNF